MQARCACRRSAPTSCAFGTSISSPSTSNSSVCSSRAQRLSTAGIAYRALKGPLLAHLAYPDPALRSFGDVDVLVGGASFDAAVDALARLGFRRHFAEPRPGFDARFAKGACLVRRDGMEVDLHRTLAPGAFGILLQRVDLFRRPVRTFRLGSHWITGLDAETVFVHACFHAALGNHPPRLVPLRDVVQLHTAGLDAGAVIAMFTSARCESVCRRALDLVDAELGVHLEGPIPAWAAGQRPSRFDRWALQSYTSNDRSYAGQVAASIWAIPSLRDRFAYSAALAFPTREYARAHDRGYARRVVRGLRVVKDSLPVRTKRSAAEPVRTKRSAAEPVWTKRSAAEPEGAMETVRTKRSAAEPEGATETVRTKRSAAEPEGAMETVRTKRSAAEPEGAMETVRTKRSAAEPEGAMEDE